MIKTIIFDLSDVLIRGLTGIEEQLQLYLSYPKEDILRQLRSDALLLYVLGKCTEDEYLQHIMHEYSWTIPIEQLKTMIRANFTATIPGSQEILITLSERYPLFLLSDHAREWVQFIEEKHTFLQLFKHRFYSFELQVRKNNPKTYRKVLSEIRAEPKVCLFIDDSPMFFQVAQKIGMNVIHFKDSNQLLKELKTHSISA